MRAAVTLANSNDSNFPIDNPNSDPKTGPQVGSQAVPSSPKESSKSGQLEQGARSEADLASFSIDELSSLGHGGFGKSRFDPIDGDNSMKGKSSSRASYDIFGHDEHEPRVVTARGTEHGLVLRIDGKAEWILVREELDHFLGGRRKFFEGGEVSIEWIDRLPTPEQGKELGDYLLSQYGLSVVTRRRRVAHGNTISGVAPLGGLVSSSGNTDSKDGLSATPRHDAPKTPPTAATSLNSGNLSGDDEFVMSPPSSARPGVTVSLFPQGNLFAQGDFSSKSEEELFVSGVVESGEWQNFERSTPGRNTGTGGNAVRGNNIQGGGRMMFDDESEVFSSSAVSPKRVASQMAKMLGGPDLFYEDDANAKILFGTLRSGQRVETPFSLIVVGDVNPGADLVAGGDIVVLGSLRGTAHASAYDDDSFDRVIIALQMQPMQLRIGSVLSRGSEEVVRGAEIARIENRRIVVEAFNPRMLWGRKIRS